jgi:signal peptidase II
MLRLGLAIAAAVAAVDQLVKWWIIDWLADPPGFVEVLPFFNLVMVWNRGVSFGLLGDADLAPYLMAGIAGLVVIVLVIWLAGVSERLLAASIGLIIGGALGNIVDRLVYGAVADFVDVHAGGYHWPAFNVADAAITVGVAVMLIDGLLNRRGAPK